MNNIIKSQLMLCKKRAWIIAGCLLFSILMLFLVLSTSETVKMGLSNGGSIAMLSTAILPGMLITYSYAERIQIYEIMSGFKPHQILLARTAVFLPFTLIFLIGFTAMCLHFDSSTQTVQSIALYWVITFRAVLGIIFLSPLMKEAAVIPTLSIMLIMISGTDLEALSHSPFSFLCYEQSLLLAAPITDSFVIKVIVSAIFSCTLYYLIGYFTLKKKIDLEPHKLT